MARKVHLDTGYIFVPSANRITIDKAIPREKLLLITNLNTNTVLFNFSDPNLKVNSYTRTRDSQISVTGTPGSSQVTNLWPQITPVVGQRITGYGILANSYITAVSGVTITINTVLTADPYTNANTPVTIYGTVIVLNYNTSSMNATDKLQIFVDEYEETIRPAEVMTDPVSKMRVSTPQALIDTDFEYGLQPTKWESLQLIANRPSYYTVVTAPISFSTMATTNASRVITVNAQTQLTGTITTTASTAVTGQNTRFTSEAKIGSLIFSSTGAFIGAVASVVTDTSLTLKANALVTQTTLAAFATGQRFFDNGAPGTGIFAGTGTITTNTASTAFSTAGNGALLSELRAGDKIFDVAGNLVGTVAAVTTNNAGTFTTNAAVTIANAAFEISQYTTGNPIYTQYSLNADANGSFLINGPLTGNLSAHCSFTYEMEVTATSTGSILDNPNTIISIQVNRLVEQLKQRMLLMLLQQTQPLR